MFVYMVRCADGSLYTGVAIDVEKRVARHNLGKGSKYCRSRLPVHLVYTEELGSFSLALKREYAIKRMTRLAKEGLLRA